MNPVIKRWFNGAAFAAVEGGLDGLKYNGGLSLASAAAHSLPSPWAIGSLFVVGAVDNFRDYMKANPLPDVPEVAVPTEAKAQALEIAKKVIAQQEPPTAATNTAPAGQPLIVDGQQSLRDETKTLLDRTKGTP